MNISRKIQLLVIWLEKVKIIWLQKRRGLLQKDE